MKGKKPQKKEKVAAQVKQGLDQPSFCCLQKLLVFCSFGYAGNLLPLCNVNFAKELLLLCLLKAEVEARLKDRETVLAGKIGKLQTR